MAKAAPSPPKLPVQQLTILAIARLAEPLAYTSVFPYLPEMMRDFGVGQDDVAKWAGLTSAVFAVCQGFAAVPWTRASDRFGRKPILLCGLLSTMVCFLVWGMSTSLPMAMAMRAVQGAGNGNVAIIRTIVAEIVPDKQLQPRAFSIMPLVWSLGSVAGPVFGGMLAQPARKYPGLFGGSAFFRRFPYALPNLVATVFFLISAATTLLFLRESLPARRARRDWGIVAGQRLTRALSCAPLRARRRRPPSSVHGEAAPPPAPAPAPRPPSCEPPAREGRVFTRPTVVNLVSYTILCLHSVSFDQNITVFLNYPVVEHTPDNTRLPFYFNGGLGLLSDRIGTLFALYGIGCGVFQLTLYPPLVHRFGISRCWKVCAVGLPFVYLMAPYAVLLPTRQARVAAVVAIMLLKGFATTVALPCNTILLINGCASVAVLGTVNGLATAFSGFARAIGPASTGLAFTWGVQNGFVVVAFFFLALVAAIGAVPALMTVEGDGPTAPTDDADADADAQGNANDGALGAPLESAALVDDDQAGAEAAASAPLLGKPTKQGATYGAVNGGQT